MMNSENTENINVTVSEALSDTDVTSHTSAMWKYNPIPEKPFPAPEYLRSMTVEGDISVCAARVRGKMHKHDGSNGDDWFSYSFSDDKSVLFAAVSDGAGSKPLSRLGARCATENAVSYLKQQTESYFSENTEIVNALSLPYSDDMFNAACTDIAMLMRDAVMHSAECVDKLASELSENDEITELLGRNAELADLSATILLLMLIPVGDEYFVSTVQIGDGAIASFDSSASADDVLRILGGADSGDFSGETDFITTKKTVSSDEIMKRTRVQRRKVTDIMLMTDGVSDDYYPNNPNLLLLYIDMLLNEIEKKDEEKAVVSEENRPYVSKIPRPQSYPWVNDNDVSFTYQYASDICASTGLSPKELWEKKDVLGASSLSSFDVTNPSEAKSDRLCDWLDNYVRRGSFDDRTLMWIHLDNGNEGSV